MYTGKRYPYTAIPIIGGVARSYRSTLKEVVKTALTKQTHRKAKYVNDS